MNNFSFGLSGDLGRLADGMNPMRSGELYCKMCGAPLDGLNAEEREGGLHPGCAQQLAEQKAKLAEKVRADLEAKQALLENEAAWNDGEDFSQFK